MLIQSLSDTALAVAYARALESERPDAVFNDPFARVLAGERGKVIYQQLQGDRSIGWFISARTVVLDELIRQEIQQNDVDTVLNLAAGLDTRPYRMALPSTLRWIEVDLPPIFAYKQEKLLDVRPVCQLERVSIDLTNRQQCSNLLSQVNATAKKVLVITEGFLVYLPPAQVALLAGDLASQPAITAWLSDFVSPLSVKIAQLRMSREAIAADVQLQFAPNDIPQFFEPYGWQVKVARSLWHEAHRLKREVFFGKLARWLPPFRVQVALLQRSLPPSAFLQDTNLLRESQSP